jgi:hypothetical protein
MTLNEVHIVSPLAAARARRISIAPVAVSGMACLPLPFVDAWRLLRALGIEVADEE